MTVTIHRDHTTIHTTTFWALLDVLHIRQFLKALKKAPAEQTIRQPKTKNRVRGKNDNKRARKRLLLAMDDATGERIVERIHGRKEIYQSWAKDAPLIRFEVHNETEYFEGVKGEEHLVKIEYEDGLFIEYYHGKRNEERKDSAEDRSSGELVKFFFCGPRHNEFLVMKELANGKTQHFEGTTPGHEIFVGTMNEDGSKDPPSDEESDEENSYEESDDEEDCTNNVECECPGCLLDLENATANRVLNNLDKYIKNSEWEIMLQDQELRLELRLKNARYASRQSTDEASSLLRLLRQTRIKIKRRHRDERETHTKRQKQARLDSERKKRIETEEARREVRRAAEVQKQKNATIDAAAHRVAANAVENIVKLARIRDQESRRVAQKRLENIRKLNRKVAIKDAEIRRVTEDRKHQALLQKQRQEKKPTIKPENSAGKARVNSRCNAPTNSTPIEHHPLLPQPKKGIPPTPKKEVEIDFVVEGKKIAKEEKAERKERRRVQCSRAASLLTRCAHDFLARKFAKRERAKQEKLTKSNKFYRECAICFEELICPEAFNCGHVFCASCASRAAMCFICDAEITSRLRIFL